MRNWLHSSRRSAIERRASSIEQKELNVMPMPPQLAQAKRRRSRHSEPRPTIELMPSISIHELRHAIPRYQGQVNEPNVTLKYPNVARLRLFATHIEITGRNGHMQRFRIAWIRTGMGRHRPILVCN